MARIGVVGLGALGQAIARRLLKTGHTVVGFNRTRSKAEQLKPEGLIVAETLGDACGADFVLNVLWDDAAVEELLLPNGDLFSAGYDLCHISVSTISIPLVRRLAEKHRALGQPFISAPVFGRPEEASDGHLVVLTGGPAEAIEQARPVLESLGRVEMMGEDVGAANAVKMAGNFMMGSALESLREAIGLVRAVDVNAAQFVDIIASSILPAPFYKGYGAALAKADPGSRLPNPFLHSVELSSEAGLALGLDLPVAKTIARGSS